MRKIIPALILACSLIACKKSYYCEFTYQHIASGFAFAGFTSQEVDTLYLSQYAANTSFATLIRRDTLRFDSIVIDSGTAYLIRKEGGWIGLSSGADYELEVPATGTYFRISNLTLSPEPAGFTSDHRCKAQHFIESPYSATINGKTVGALFRNYKMLPGFYYWNYFILSR